MLRIYHSMRRQKDDRDDMLMHMQTAGLPTCTGAARTERRMRLEGQLSRLERVPDDPKPTEHHISELVSAHTCAHNPRHRHRMVRTIPSSL